MNEMSFEALAPFTKIGVSMYRSKVPGGWLVLAVAEEQIADDARGAAWKATKQVTRTVGVTFYPDAQHAWDGASLT